MKRIFFVLSVLFFLSLGVSSVFAQDLHTRQAALPCLNKTFTVVAHILQDSTGFPGGQDLANLQDLILQNIDSTNKFFSPICIDFEICEFRIIENFQYYNIADEEEWEILQTQYNLENRINMYFLGSTFAGPECGFALQDGIGLLDTGGVVVHTGCLSPVSKAIPAQLGHYFGLHDTYEADLFGAEPFVRVGCDTLGDLLCDTPADPLTPPLTPNMTSFINVGEGCRFISTITDDNGDFYIPDVGNIMSLYPDECRCGFSYEQLKRMAETCIEAGGGMW